MSLKAITWAFELDDARLTPVAKLVLLAIADAAREEKDFECDVRHETLARKAHVSSDTTQRRVKDLCALGYLYVMKRRGDDGCKISNRYIVLLNERARLHASANGWDGEIGAVESDDETETTDRSAERTNEMDSHASKPQAAAWSRPQGERNQAAGETEPSRTAAATEQTLTVFNNTPPTPLRGEGEGEQASLSGTTNGEAEANRRRCGRGDADEDGARLARWEKFRREWPWDTTELPEKARRAFMALSNGEQIAAVACGPRYIEDCVRRDRKIAHAKTWLAGKGWQSWEAERAKSKIEMEREQLAAAKAKTHELQRQKYGGIVVRKGTPQAAAWARHDGVALAFQRVGFWEAAVVKPSEWPPSAAHADAPRDGPEGDLARV
jgi:hypothetical protein